MNIRRSKPRRTPRLAAVASILLVAGGLALFPAPAGGGSLKVGIYQNSPKVFWEADGKAQGLFIDILEQIARNEKWAIRYVPGTWDESLRRLEKGELDLMVDVTHSEERAALFDFNKIPVIESWLQAFTLGRARVDRVRDLNGRKIAILKGAVQEDYLNREIRKRFGIDFTVLTYPDYQGTVEALRSNQAEVLIANRFFYFSSLRGSDIVPTPLLFRPASVYFAFPKNRGQELTTAFDRNLAAMKNDPRSAYYSSLYRWLGMRTREFIPRYLQWLLLAALGLLLTAGLFALVLKREVAAKTMEIRLIADRCQEASDMLDAVFNVIPDILGIQDAEHGVVRYNKAGYEYLKCSHLDTQGKKCFQLINRDQPCEVCPVGQAVESGKPARVEKYVMELGVWLDARAYPVLDEQGRVKMVIEHLRDITAAKQKEKDLFDKNMEMYLANQKLTQADEELQAADDELRQQLTDQAQSEERFRLLAENANDLIYRMKVPEGTYEYVSPSSSAVLGYPPEEVYMKPGLLADIVHPDWRKYLEAQWQAVLEGKEPEAFEFPVIDRQGRTRWLSQHNSYLRDKTGRLIAIQGIVRDITQVKKAEAALVNEKEWRDAVIRSVPILVAALGSNSEILMFNAHAEKLTGYQAGEVLGKSWAEVFIPRESRLEFQKFWEELVQGKRPGDSRVNPILAKDGSLINISWTNTILKEGGKFRMVLSIGQKIPG
jgi:PAS domain S-box-containing protein